MMSSRIPRFFPPTSGAVTSGFGLRLHPILQVTKFHSGVDYEAGIGTPVRAAARGQVVVAERKGEYGNLVVIKHGGNLETAYGHLSRIDTKIGDCIEKGAQIGLAGATGLVEGPKLHFELRHNGQFIDPLSMIEGARR